MYAERGSFKTVRKIIIYTVWYIYMRILHTSRTFSTYNKKI
jgi:hypothetical protein